MALVAEIARLERSRRIGWTDEEDPWPNGFAEEQSLELAEPWAASRSARKRQTAALMRSAVGDARPSGAVAVAAPSSGQDKGSIAWHGDLGPPGVS